LSSIKFKVQKFLGPSSPLEKNDESNNRRRPFWSLGVAEDIALGKDPYLFQTCAQEILREGSVHSFISKVEVKTVKH